ncbi:hypothetical protein ACFL02_01030 [Planctomycetota bacterium]
MTVFAMAMLGILVIAMLSTATTDLQLVKNHIYSQQAHYIAEAGIADAIDRIQQDTVGSGEWETVFPPGATNKYQVVVSEDSPVVIRATGIVESAGFSKILEVKLRVTGSSAPYRVSIAQWKEVLQ